jgi:hypothetical protein
VISGGCVPASPSPTGSPIFFMGSRSFRSWRTLRVVLVRVAVSAAAFSLVAGGLVWQPPLSNYILAIPLIGGTVALAFAASLLSAFGVAKVDQVLISNRGVKCGDRFWDWECVRAFRTRRTRPSGAIRLFIWTGEDKGPGRSIAMDERITPERALGLIGRVGEFCAANNFKVTCEASC